MQDDARGKHLFRGVSLPRMIAPTPKWHLSWLLIALSSRQEAISNAFERADPSPVFLQFRTKSGDVDVNTLRCCVCVRIVDRSDERMTSDYPRGIHNERAQDPELRGSDGNEIVADAYKLVSDIHPEVFKSQDSLQIRMGRVIIEGALSLHAWYRFSGLSIGPVHDGSANCIMQCMIRTLLKC
jgi:hypothetical protein